MASCLPAAWRSQLRRAPGQREAEQLQPDPWEAAVLHPEGLHCNWGHPQRSTHIPVPSHLTPGALPGGH